MTPKARRRIFSSGVILSPGGCEPLAGLGHPAISVPLAGGSAASRAVTMAGLADRHQGQEQLMPLRALVTSRMPMALMLPTWRESILTPEGHLLSFLLLLLTRVHIHANPISAPIFPKMAAFSFSSCPQSSEAGDLILSSGGLHMRFVSSLARALTMLRWVIQPFAFTVKVSSSVWSHSLALGGCSHSENQFCALGISSVFRSSCHIQSRGVAQLRCQRERS